MTMATRASTGANVHRARGFQRHLVAAVAQLGQQRQTAALRQRLATGDTDVVRRMARNALQDLRHGEILAAVEGIFGVAPNAAQRTPGEPHEHRGQADTAGFALQREKDFGDAQ